MIFDGRLGRGTTVQVNQISPENFAFDWDSCQFVMVDGSPLALDGIDGAKAWLTQCIHTRRGIYAIYPADYGCSALDLVGSKLHRGTALPMLESELQDSVKYCDEIISIGNVRYTDGVITCEVTMDAGRGIITEVIELD